MNAELFLEKAELVLGENADGTDLRLIDDLTLFQDIAEVMEQYAQQRERETAIEFLYCYEYPTMDKIYCEDEFDEWKKQQK